MPTTPTTEPRVPSDHSLAPPSRPAVPTLDEILRLEPGERWVFRGVDWAFYERVHEVVGLNRWHRIAFDGKDLEIMPTSGFHDFVTDFSFRFIEIVTEELEIAPTSLGSTTWMRAEIQRGIEADQCFFFTPEKLAMIGVATARAETDIAAYPNPDLAIEVDISEPKVDRPGIYAALRVPEIWRFGKTGLIIVRLTDRGAYADAGRSGFLPIVADEVARWVLEEDRSNLLDWKRRLRAWVRAELVGRVR
jgi:Uma2 family endonuclease